MYYVFAFFSSIPLSPPFSRSTTGEFPWDYFICLLIHFPGFSFSPFTTTCLSQDFQWMSFKCKSDRIIPLFKNHQQFSIAGRIQSDLCFSSQPFFIYLPIFNSHCSPIYTLHARLKVFTLPWSWSSLSSGCFYLHYLPSFATCPNPSQPRQSPSLCCCLFWSPTPSPLSMLNILTEPLWWPDCDCVLNCTCLWLIPGTFNI